MTSGVRPEAEMAMSTRSGDGGVPTLDEAYSTQAGTPDARRSVAAESAA